jgi:membrane dipeptidase
MRQACLAIPVLCVFALCATSSDEKAGGGSAPAKRGKVVVTEEALKIHREAILIDGHNDLPWQYREKADLSFGRLDIRKPQPAIHTDLPRLRKGGVGAQFWSAYVPASTRKEGSAVRQTLEQIDVVHRMIKTYPDDFELALTVDDILRIRKKGKIASLIGVEGGHSIDNSLGVLRMMHQLGVRYLTLTHSETLDWADSATDLPKNNGLSKFGEQVVGEMNRLGMLVDISHVSADTMRHALKVSRAPVIASHSSAFALADHVRNVPDDVLKLVKANGGVVMVNFYSGFVVPEAVRIRRDFFNAVREMKKKYTDEKQLEAAVTAWLKERPIPRGTVHDLVDHIEHIIKVGGIDHVGLGSDYDGISTTPEQMEDVSCYPVLTQALLDRGHSKEQIHKVLGGNLLRAMRQAEGVARKLSKPE